MRRKVPPLRASSGMAGFVSRLRMAILWRAGVFPVWSKLRGWPIAVWLVACFALVTVLATLQFEWIREVSKTQQIVARANLRLPMYGAMDRFREEIKLLLSTFRPVADTDPSNRLRSYWESYASWHALSAHGPAIRRILFYDISSDGRRELTELIARLPGLKPASWDEELVSARQHIDDSAMGPDRTIGRRWAVTWMFHPQAMALYRPIIRQDAHDPGQSADGNLTGFLLIQLDLDFIRDRLIPELLGIAFRRLNSGNDYIASVAVDGRSLFIYDPVRASEAKPGETLADFEGYSLRPLGQMGKADEIGVPDYEVPFPLSTNSVTESMAQRGAVQRLALRSRLGTLGLTRPDRGPPGAVAGMRPAASPRIDSQDLSFGWSSNLPRLVVIADAPYRVTLRSRRERLSIAAAVNQRYKRSVSRGILVLLLLVGAMAMVALSARRAARLAATRMEAAASQSHQLRNPLAGISLLADNMVRGALGRGEKVIAYGEQLREYGRQLNGLVDRTMQLVSMDSPLRQYHLASTDVSAVAREALQEARPAIDGAGFNAECYCPEGLSPVQADREALRECLGELLANAVKYGLPGRWVRIEAEEAGSGRGREVRVRVRDRGPGISAREARKIFEPFYRVPAVATSSIPGSGLGLALARSTVEGMGGRLTLESQPGRGSAFSVHFDVPLRHGTGHAVDVPTRA